MAIANFFQRMDMKNLPTSFGSPLEIPSPTQVKLVSDDGKMQTILGGNFELSMSNFSLTGTISSLELSVSNVPQFRISMTSNNDIKIFQSFVEAKNGLGMLGYIFGGNDTITGSSMDDIFGGFAGNDLFDGGTGNDVVFFSGNYANYTVTPTATNVSVQNKVTGEVDALTNVEMLAFADSTIPTPVYDAIALSTPTPTTTPIKISKKPSTSNDQLTGTGKADKLDGLAGNDTLTGGNGADKLTGGTGKDIFKFNNVKESGITDKSRDIITDFNSKEGDKIDLSAIDANSKLAKDQAFKFMGSDKFSPNATAQVRFDAKTHILYGSIDADSDPEFSIQINGTSSLVVTDFIL